MGLLLNIDDSDEIAIPSCLADSNLSLCEIGVLFCLTAMSETGKGLKRFERGDVEFIAAMQSLKSKGVLTMDIEGRNLKIHIAVEKIQPESEVQP